MIVNLGRVVEYAARTRTNYINQGLARLGLTFKQALEVGHVTLVVLLVVKLERLPAHDRSEGVLVVWQWRNFEVHAVLSFER